MSVYKIIETGNAPSPGGHYSQGVVHNSVITVSGQLPFGPDNADNADNAGIADNSFEIQVRLALTNFLNIVLAGGGTVDSVISVRAYIVGVDNWPLFNQVYAEIFGNVRPARAVVPVPHLHHGALVEIEGTAAIAS